MGVLGVLRRDLLDVQADLTGLLERFSRDQKRRAAVFSGEKRKVTEEAEQILREQAIRPANTRVPQFSTMDMVKRG